MRDVTVFFLVGISLAGCSAPTIYAEIDQRYTPPQNMDTRLCAVEYRLTLNEDSADYRIVQSPDNEITHGGKVSFPLGETISAYLIQAQRGQTGKEISLNFFTSDFNFSYAGGSLSKPFSPSIVGEVRYRARFLGPDPIGNITFEEESSAKLPRLWQDVAEAQERQQENTARFYAVAQALRSTTTKLLLEVQNRICPSSTIP